MQKRPLLKEFASYTTLNVLGMMGLSGYILADTFFISKGLGASGLTALNLAIPVYSFIHGLGLMLGMGGATKYSIFKSRKEQKNSNAVFSNTFFVSALASMIFIFLGIFLSGAITKALGADTQVYEMTNTYVKFILLFAPAFIANDVMICFVRNDGKPELSMLAMLVGSFSNILLDYVFIFPLNMGIFGAVFATGLAPLISLLVLSVHRIKRSNAFYLVRTKPYFRLIGETISLGIPSLVGEVSSGIVIIVFNMIIVKLEGNIGVAAYGVIANLSLIVVALYTGIAQGIQPLLSRAYGANDDLSIKRILRYALLTVLVVSVLIYAAIFCFADSITQLFNSEANMKLQSVAAIGLKLYFTAVLFLGFNIILSVFFTSTENARPAHAISLSRGLFIIVPLAFILSYMMGITGVWLTFPVTEGLVAILGAMIYFWYSNVRNHILIKSNGL